MHIRSCAILLMILVMLGCLLHVLQAQPRPFWRNRDTRSQLRSLERKLNSIERRYKDMQTTLFNMTNLLTEVVNTSRAQHTVSVSKRSVTAEPDKASTNTTTAAGAKTAKSSDIVNKGKTKTPAAGKNATKTTPAPPQNKSTTTAKPEKSSKPTTSKPTTSKPMTSKPTTSRRSTVRTCRGGFISAGRGVCLSRVSPAPMSFMAASSTCQSIGGRVLEIESKLKFLIVRRLITDDRQLWVGASFKPTLGDFVWNSSGRRVQVKVQGLPFGGATCAVMVLFRSPGHLATLDCFLPRFFICEQAN